MLSKVNCNTEAGCFLDLICLSEYKKARMALGNVSDESAENQYLRRSLPFVDMIADASGDLPMVSSPSMLVPRRARASSGVLRFPSPQVFEFFTLFHCQAPTIILVAARVHVPFVGPL
jgi:hypothetical protein